MRGTASQCLFKHTNLKQWCQLTKHTCSDNYPLSAYKGGKIPAMKGQNGGFEQLQFLCGGSSEKWTFQIHSFMIPGLNLLPVLINLHTQKWIRPITFLLISAWFWLCPLNGFMITSILNTGEYFYLTRSWGMESQEEIGLKGPSAVL